MWFFENRQENLPTEVLPTGSGDCGTRYARTVLVTGEPIVKTSVDRFQVITNEIAALIEKDFADVDR